MYYFDTRIFDPNLLSTNRRKAILAEIDIIEIFDIVHLDNNICSTTADGSEIYVIYILYYLQRNRFFGARWRDGK